MSVRTEDLTPRHWPAIERLFGARGACGGCWCMHWRARSGEHWDANKGAVNRRRFRRLVSTGRAGGVLAFRGEEPVGWLACGPRTDFTRLQRARTLACDDADRVWSLPCFFVKSGHRGQGVATALLSQALRSLRKRGVAIVEGYPANPRARLPAAFAFTGTTALFARAGFQAVGNIGGGRQRMRRTLLVRASRPDR